MRRCGWLVSFLFTVNATAGMAFADTVDLTPTADNTLYEDTTGGKSNGAGQYLFAGVTDVNKKRRALMRFDIAGSIPAGSVITSVDLHLFMSRTKAASTAVELYPVVADWGEGTSDASGEEGGGTASTVSDATWIHTFFDTALWTSAGGDYAAAASATTSVNDVGAYTWATTASLVADVQAWLDGTSLNHGWILIGSEPGPQTAKRFESRENATVANRPRLTVVFTPPALGACCDGTGGCSEVAPSDCAGTYQGDGTTCGAGGTCGACCDGAMCEYTVQATCTSYRGDGTSCQPDPCSVPVLGACCEANGSCSEVEAAACTGTFQGDATTCGVGGTCGSCCDGANCDLAVASSCAGTYIGDGTTCVTDPCTVETGACCLGTSCSDAVTDDECFLLGGEYQGDGQSCSTAPCHDKSRACCFPNEVCIVMNRDECDRQGGDRQGGSSTCADNPCATTGACCFGTSCTPNMDHDTCEDQGGDFKGGEDCLATTCEDHVRACCWPNGDCTEIDERLCDSQGGDHQDAGVTCAQAPCAGQACSASQVLPLGGLMAVKENNAADVQLTWTPDPSANGYNTWFVTDKVSIPLANSTGPATSVTGCFNAAGADCLHVGAVAPTVGRRLYYNVLGVCDGIEAAQ